MYNSGGGVLTDWVGMLRMISDQGHKGRNIDDVSFFDMNKEMKARPKDCKFVFKEHPCD